MNRTKFQYGIKAVFLSILFFLSSMVGRSETVELGTIPVKVGEYAYNATLQGQIDEDNKTATIYWIDFSDDLVNTAIEAIGESNLEDVTKYGVMDITFPSTVTVNNVEYTVTKIATEDEKESPTVKSDNYRWDSGEGNGLEAGWGFFVKSITIPNSVITLGTYAFYNLYNMESVVFQEGSQLVEVGKYCFANNEGTLPATSEQTKLKSITIPASVKTLGDYCFTSSKVLSNIRFEVGSQLESIGIYCFSLSNNLTSIILPAELTSIGSSAFTNHLSTVILLGGNVDATSLDRIPSTATVYSTADYSNVENGSKVTTLPSIPTFTTADGSGDGYLLPTVTKDGDNTTYTFDITDGDWTSFSTQAANKTVNLNYTRTFGAKGWFSWFMPFQFTLNDDIIGKVKFAYPVSIMNEGESSSAWTLAVVVMKSGDLVKANLPYCIKSLDADGATTLNITDATLQATSVESPLNVSNVLYIMKFTGNYVQKPFTDGQYSLSSNGSGFIYATSDYNLPPFRFVMDLSDNEDNPYTSSTNAKPLNISIAEYGDEATAIRAINKVLETGNGKVYDLQGRRVSKPVRGIYIQDGKKVLVEMTKE